MKYGEEQTQNKVNGNRKGADNFQRCALTAPTRICHTIFEPMAALMLKYFSMALLLWVLNPSIFNPGTTFLWTHPVDPMTMITILHEYVVSIYKFTQRTVIHKFGVYFHAREKQTVLLTYIHTHTPTYIHTHLHTHYHKISRRITKELMLHLTLQTYITKLNKIYETGNVGAYSTYDGQQHEMNDPQSSEKNTKKMFQGQSIKS